MRLHRPDNDGVRAPGSKLPDLGLQLGLEFGGQQLPQPGCPKKAQYSHHPADLDLNRVHFCFT